MTRVIFRVMRAHLCMYIGQPMSAQLVVKLPLQLVHDQGVRVQHTLHYSWAIHYGSARKL
jgi:hypothetical protein